MTRKNVDVQVELVCLKIENEAKWRRIKNYEILPKSFTPARLKEIFYANYFYASLSKKVLNHARKAIA